MGEPFTVFHLDSEDLLRGGQSQLLFLAQELKRRGHKNIVTCKRGSALDREALSRKLERLHLPFLAEYDPISAWQLRKAALGASRPVLHAHTSATAGLAFVACEGAGLARVVHRRHAYRLDDSLDATLKYRRAFRVLAVSDHVAKGLVESRVARDRIIVARDCCPPGSPGRDREGIGRSRAELAKDVDIHPPAIWIGNFAALSEDKGHAVLLPAFAQVYKAYPESYLLLTGEGPLFTPLFGQARALGVEDRVRFLGYRPDAAKLLRCLDLYVQPSLDEGLGSEVLAAMAAGVPVVASKAGGLREIVKDRETGLLIEPGYPDLLAARMSEVLGDFNLAEALAKKALDGVSQFSVERLADKVEEAYGEALSHPQPKGGILGALGPKPDPAPAAPQG